VLPLCFDITSCSADSSAGVRCKIPSLTKDGEPMSLSFNEKATLSARRRSDRS
jgi:hypothetical protein